MAATPAIAALEAAGIDFAITEYEPDHEAGGHGEALVAATGLDPERAAKTLVALVDDRPVVAVVPVAGTLDLKALARAADGKRATMADPDDAERWTGSVVGGIAPLGHRRRLPVYIEIALTDHDLVHVSGGRRGLEISLPATDLVRVSRAVAAPIAR